MKLSLLLLFPLALTTVGVLSAQSPDKTQSIAPNEIWSEDFDYAHIDTFKKYWPTGVIGGNITHQWDWSDQADIAEPFPSYPVFQSKTASNGFAYFNFNVQGLGQYNVHMTYSETIDCSDKQEVWLYFNSQYSHWSGLTNSAPFVEVIVGSNVYSFPVLETVEPNTIPYPAENLIVDLTERAAGEVIQLRFRWFGNTEYIWKIDDIGLWDGNPTEQNNLRLLQHQYAIAPNTSIPAGMTTPVHFAAGITNKGTETQENVRIAVEVNTNPNQSAPVFTDTLYIGTVLPEDTLLMNVFENSFTPPKNKVAKYTATYKILADATDEWLVDNSVSFSFNTTNDLFSKDLKDYIAIAAPKLNDGQTWTYGNCYYMPDGHRYIAKVAKINLFAFPELAGEKLNVVLYKWEDNGDGIVNPSEIGLSSMSSGYAVAQATYTIQGIGNESKTLTLEGLEGHPDSAFLEDNSYYLLLCEFTYNNAAAPDITVFYWGSSLDYSTTHLASLQKNQPYYFTFYGDDLPSETDLIQTFDAAPAIELGVEEVITSIPSTFPDPDAFSLFPNPARNSTWLEVNTQKNYGPLDIKIIDNNGRTLNSSLINDRPPFQQEIDLGNYPSGSYFLQISNKNGYQTSLPFIVKK